MKQLVSRLALDDQALFPSPLCAPSSTLSACPSEGLPPPQSPSYLPLPHLRPPNAVQHIMYLLRSTFRVFMRSLCDAPLHPPIPPSISTTSAPSRSWSWPPSEAASMDSPSPPLTCADTKRVRLSGVAISAWSGCRALTDKFCDLCAHEGFMMKPVRPSHSVTHSCVAIACSLSLCQREFACRLSPLTLIPRLVIDEADPLYRP